LVYYKNDKPKLIEVKPEATINMWNNPIKITAMKKFAKKNDWNFQIWSEKELGI